MLMHDCCDILSFMCKSHVPLFPLDIFEGSTKHEKIILNEL